MKKIYSMDNLRLAHRNAKRDKSHYREVKMVDSNPEFYLKNNSGYVGQRNLSGECI